MRFDNTYYLKISNRDGYEQGAGKTRIRVAKLFVIWSFKEKNAIMLYIMVLLCLFNNIKFK